MTIKIKIHSNAFNATGALAGYATERIPQSGGSLQYPVVPLPLGTTGVTGAPGPGFIASAPGLSFRRNILEDGTFPTAPAATATFYERVYVHVSPTSGSTVMRGSHPLTSNAEFNPAYGLDVDRTGIELEDSVFESAVKDPIGAGFMASLQDLVEREVIQVVHNGTPLGSTGIRDFTA